MDDHVNLPMKYQPRRFDQILGQETITGSLRDAIREDNLRQVYLFEGGTGTGKTSTAVVMAMASNCDHPEDDGEPCGTCSACEPDSAGYSMFSGLHLIDCATSPDRDAIMRQFVHLGSGWKNRDIWVLDEAQCLTTQAQSWLLNPFERLQRDSTIVLCTTEPDSLLPTLRARCVTLRFNRVPDDQITALVERIAGTEDLEVTPEQIRDVVVDAAGSARNAIANLDALAHGGSVGGRNAAEQIIEAMATGDIGGVLLEVRRAARQRELHVPSVINLGVSFLLDALVTQNGQPELLRVSPSLREHIPMWTSLPTQVLGARLQTLLEAQANAPRGLTAEVALEASLVSTMTNHADIDHRTLLNKVDQLGQRVDALIDQSRVAP